MTQPTVFISYSPQDETYKNELITHLGVLQQQGLIDAWSADNISPGAFWAAEIERAINQARVAILLITANFLSSELLQTEVNRLLERRTQEGLTMFPIIARACAWRTVPWLAKMKVRPAHEQPVWREGGRYADEELAAIAEEIAGIMAGADQQSSEISLPVEKFPPGPGSVQQITALQEALTRRSLVLFIGTDLPREITGLPSRADLAYDLAHRHGLDRNLPLSEVAQRVSQAGNRWEFTNFIRIALDTTGQSPQSFHHKVVSLTRQYQIETIITLAYDNLLELAFQQASLGINKVIRGDDTRLINADRPVLIKLYGDAQQPDTLVVTDRDHNNLLRDRDREALIDELRRAFRRNTILFLGYSLADSDFRFIFDQVAGSRFARTAYAVWPGSPKIDIQMWRDRGIVILDQGPLILLDRLAASSTQHSSTKTKGDSSCLPAP